MVTKCINLNIPSPRRNKTGENERRAAAGGNLAGDRERVDQLVLIN